MSDYSIKNGISIEHTVAKMSELANQFIGKLDVTQRSKALFRFDHPNRYKWHYTPVVQQGLMLKDMSKEQTQAAFNMMNIAYSDRSMQESHEIIEIETILSEWEDIIGKKSRFERSPLRYWFSVFGNPGGIEPWGFKVGGHHIALCVTVVGKDKLNATPLFIGVNPAKVMHGKHKGKRVLAKEEDLARALLLTLSPEQKKSAVVDPTPPADILTKNYRVATPGTIPQGIDFSKLHDTQRTHLLNLVRHYVDRWTKSISTSYWRELQSAGWESLSFTWAGGQEAGKPHYYAIQNNKFVIEYDNTQDGANHIHSVLRDFSNDWGEDLLAKHYKHMHQ